MVLSALQDEQALRAAADKDIEASCAATERKMTDVEAKCPAGCGVRLRCSAQLWGVSTRGVVFSGGMKKQK